MLDHKALVQGAALGWLDADKTARLIIDGNFHILWANRPAQTILTDRKWGEERPEGVTCLNGAGLAGLAGEVMKLGHEDILVHSCAKAGIDDILMVIRVLPDTLEGDSLYGIELRRQKQAHECNYAGYRAYFGFTPAEDRVVQQLLSGHVVEQCAENLDVSIDTVRSHVRQIYSKMGISSREALFHALMLFRVP